MILKGNSRQRRLLRILCITFAILAGITILFCLIRLGYNVDGTGFNRHVEAVPLGRQEQPAKTLWDWMQLLIVPIVLAFGALLFNLATSRTEQKIADQRYLNDQKIADQRYQNDRQIAFFPLSLSNTGNMQKSICEQSKSSEMLSRRAASPGNTSACGIVEIGIRKHMVMGLTVPRKDFLG